MNRALSLVVVAVIVLGISSRIAIAGEVPNYSGKYLQERSKKASSALPDSMLEVIQTEDAVVITQEMFGRKFVGRVLLTVLRATTQAPEVFWENAKRVWIQRV